MLQRFVEPLRASEFLGIGIQTGGELRAIQE
jgi:hypothetical protein